MMRFYNSDYIIEYGKRNNKSVHTAIMELCETYNRDLTHYLDMKTHLVNNYQRFISHNKEIIENRINGTDRSFGLLQDEKFKIKVTLRDGQILELIPWSDPYEDEFHGGYQSMADHILYETVWDIDGNNITSRKWDIVKINSKE